MGRTDGKLTDGRTDWRTDGRTDGQGDDYMLPRNFSGSIKTYRSAFLVHIQNAGEFLYVLHSYKIIFHDVLLYL